MDFAASALLKGWELTCTHHRWLNPTQDAKVKQYLKLFSTFMQQPNLGVDALWHKNSL
jgi:hypothetical protein